MVFSNANARRGLAMCVVLAAVLAFAQASGNPKYLVGNSNGNNIQLLNTASHKLSAFTNSPRIVSPDTMIPIPGKSQFLVSVGLQLNDSAILIIDAESGRVRGRFDDGRGPLHRPYGIAFAPNGDLIVASFWNNKVLRYSKRGVYLGEVSPNPTLTKGPNALLFGKDGNLYMTTQGSEVIDGTLQYLFPTQIIRLRNNAWEVFSADATPYSSPNTVFPYASYLGLANSPVRDNYIFASDFANGILAFDLTTKAMVGRLETSFTGIPSTNGFGSLTFVEKPKHSKYEILAPGFLPNEGNKGAVLRFRFNTVAAMSTTQFSFEIAPTTKLNKPINILAQPDC